MREHVNTYDIIEPIAWCRVTRCRSIHSSSRDRSAVVKYCERT